MTNVKKMLKLLNLKLTPNAVLQKLCSPKKYPLSSTDPNQSCSSKEPSISIKKLAEKYILMIARNCLHGNLTFSESLFNHVVYKFSNKHNYFYFCERCENFKINYTEHIVTKVS